MRKILIDTGVTQRVNCRGAVPETVELIGDALAQELDSRGCETATSCRIPDLGESSGRPSRCAEMARRWGADCLLRLYVRAAADPCAGSADAMVYRTRSRSGEIANNLLAALERDTGIRNGGVRSAGGVILLRKTPCPCVILILRLSYQEKEFPTEESVHRYASALADGLLES